MLPLITKIESIVSPPLSPLFCKVRFQTLCRNSGHKFSLSLLPAWWLALSLTRAFFRFFFFIPACSIIGWMDAAEEEEG